MTTSDSDTTTLDLCECVTCGRMHRYLGEPPWALDHDALCRLSRAFGRQSDLRTYQDQKINQWLQKLLSLTAERNTDV